jgi:hypothetical protein
MTKSWAYPDGYKEGRRPTAGKGISVIAILMWAIGFWPLAWAQSRGEDLWKCSLRPTAEEVRSCEETKNAKPFQFELRLAAPGKGIEVCDAFLAILQAIPTPPTCGLSISSKFTSVFSLPIWEELDPWSNIDYLRSVDNAVRRRSGTKNREDTLSSDQWLAEYRETNRVYGLKVELKRSRIDLTGDGKEEWVLSYARIPAACNPWSGIGRGPDLLVLGEDGKTINADSDPHRILLAFQEPLVYYKNDPRFPGAHVFRFYNNGGTSFGLQVSYASPSPLSITACQVDVVKTTHSKKRK